MYKSKECLLAIAELVICCFCKEVMLLGVMVVSRQSLICTPVHTFEGSMED